MLGAGTTDSPERELWFADFLDDRSVWSSLRAALEQRGFVPDTEIVLKRPGGGHCSVLVSGAMERRGDGLPGVAHFVAKDISQRKTLEQQ